MMEELNTYFASVFTLDDTSSIPDLQDFQGAELSVLAITEKMLRKLKCLEVDKSRRPDGLNPRVLKEFVEDIVEALVVIFQESLESGKGPEGWKVANVTPLLTKGGRQKTRNYRP
eukprot:g46866.t1